MTWCSALVGSVIYCHFRSVTLIGIRNLFPDPLESARDSDVALIGHSG